MASDVLKSWRHIPLFEFDSFEDFNCHLMDRESISDKILDLMRSFAKEHGAEPTHIVISKQLFAEMLQREELFYDLTSTDLTKSPFDSPLFGMKIVPALMTDCLMVGCLGEEGVL